MNRQASAIRSACTWLARWQAGHDSRTWWPEAISRDELDSGTVSRSGPHRPSWCYGTPGIARACHLASLALSDLRQLRAAEQALTGCLTDPRQLAQLTGPGLCHGRAGLLQTARRACADSPASELAAAIDTATSLLRNLPGEPEVPADDGLLDGTAGITLASNVNHAAPYSGSRWDTCLLVG